MIPSIHLSIYLSIYLSIDLSSNYRSFSSLYLYFRLSRHFDKCVTSTGRDLGAAGGRDPGSHVVGPFVPDSATN